MWQKRLMILFLVLCTALMFVGLLPVHGEEEIYDTVVRLHVLANSDSEEDQALKLEVRDAILKVTAPLMEGCVDQRDAIERLEGAEEQILAAARSAIAAREKQYDVSITFGEEEYPERDYQSFCFPSGTYVSMRVCIGEAEGENWWCCLFPQLCLSAATVGRAEAEDACISVGLTPSQYKIITESEKPVYQVRFKLLELFGK